MGLGQKDYSDFTPINVIARGTPILVARKDAPYNTFAEMLDYIGKNPKAAYLLGIPSFQRMYDRLASQFLLVGRWARPPTS